MTPTPGVANMAPDEAMRAGLRDLFGENAVFAGDGTDESKANQVVAPNEPEDVDTTLPIDRIKSLMAALYGSDFPLINALDTVMGDSQRAMQDGMTMNSMPPLQELLKETSHDEWCMWTRGRWGLHRAAVEMHLYLIARNRLFRAGQQWVSSRGREPWRDPPRPAEQARVVHNLIAPALDQRCQIVTDQRPGFQVEPTAMSPDEKRKAEGRQAALEFQYDQQDMEERTHEAAYWAGTDGVAFWEVYWDAERGPWDERMGNMPNQRKPLGDLNTRTLRVEQVRVSANATRTEAPYYAITRMVIPETEAAYTYGAAGVQDRATTGDLAGNGDNDTSGTGADGIMPSWVLTQTIVGEGNRLNNVKTVERFTIYVERHPDVLPDGLQLTMVGNAVVWGPGELLFGTIPIIPIRDGSTDPSYYPRPIVEQWIPPQQRVNAALSLWVNSVRVNSGGRFATKPDAISRETFTGSGCSILEIESPEPIASAIMPINGFLVGQDVKDLIAFDVKAFEDMSGYNDVSRGQVSGETATAVATANEQLQRVFAPPVEATAAAFVKWAEINIAGMAEFYDIPRDVAAIGSDRPDLARAMSAKDFDGPSTIKVEGAKMMPMPHFYRKQILDDLLNRQIITAQQYMRNMMFANFKNLDSPDEDQEARAKRVADALRQGQPLPPVPPQAPPPNPMDPNDAMVQEQAQQAAAQAAAQPLALRWQTNEAIEQDVLERMILLQDDLPPQVMVAAAERWKANADQAALKRGPAPGAAPPPPSGGPPPPSGGPSNQPSPPASPMLSDTAPPNAAVPTGGALGGGGPPIITGAQ